MEINGIDMMIRLLLKFKRKKFFKMLMVVVNQKHLLICFCINRLIKIKESVYSLMIKYYMKLKKKMKYSMIKLITLMSLHNSSL